VTTSQVVRLAWLSLSTLSACATIRRDGFELGEDRWLQDYEVIQSRASFDLTCP
jgi:hypothetical protein